MTEPKFCKDCKHFVDAGAISIFGVGMSWSESCHQPPERDLIHGRKISVCPREMRSASGACGAEALLWEQKPQPEIEIKSEYSKDPPLVREPGAWIEQHIYPQPKPWWRIWE